MTYTEEQTQELEALKAIYPFEFTLLSNENDDCPNFSIQVTCQMDDNNEYDENEDSDETNENNSDKYELFLIFRLPKEYPAMGPEFKISSTSNLEECEIMELNNILKEMTKDNSGQVFSLVTQAVDWINNLKENKLLERKNAEEKKKIEEEEIERKKFEGTRVTLESFITWKRKFDAEIAANELEKNKDIKKDASGKLTGKEMFMRDKNLIDSDLNFGNLNEDTDFDESLFQEDDQNIDY